MQPVVTVLIPVYNAASYLRVCLNSIIGQTYCSLQIVLVDDGSTDDSLSICQEYAAKDSRMEVYHKENAGVAAARNDLLSFIKGTFFLFVDADDWLDAEMIEFLVSQQNEYNSDISICRAYSAEDAQTSHQMRIYTKSQAVERFLYHKEFRGSLWDKLFRSSLIGDIRFDNTVSYGEDALFCWQILQKVEKVVFSHRPLYHYRIHETSLSSSHFGSKKMSADKVWTQICNDTTLSWPSFSTIARARHCIEDTLLLRDAAHHQYQDKENVRILQKTVQSNLLDLYRTNITSIKMKFYATLASFSYRLAGLF